MTAGSREGKRRLRRDRSASSFVGTGPGELHVEYGAEQYDVYREVRADHHDDCAGQCAVDGGESGGETAPGVRLRIGRGRR